MNEAGFYPSRRLKKRRAEYIAVLNLWPFVGVLIVLFVIFTMLPWPGSWLRNACKCVTIDLAPATHSVPLPLANREDAMHLALMRDGSFFFGNLKTTSDELPAKIRECVRAGSERRVYFSARARYDDVRIGLSRIQNAGIERVAFLVEQKRLGP